jgi:outer membrane cobalamin receptor
MRTALSCIVSLPAIVFFITAQRGSAQVPADSTKEYKLHAADSAYSRIVPLSFVGSIDHTPSLVIPDSARNFSDYTFTGDPFSTVPGVFTYDLSSPGQLNGITMNGFDERSIAFFSDGAPLNDPMTGAFNLYQYPAEYADHVEIISGASAFYYGLNSNAGAINFVTRSLRAIHPYTRVRYIQAPYDHTYFDGSFSQDIVRGFNLSVGVFHNTNKGRYPNADYADWGARVKVRYDVSNRLTFFASGMYATTNLNLNGGVDAAKTAPGDPYDPVSQTLVMVNTDSYEKVHRYDTQVGAAAAFLGDTTAITTATFYHSTNFREYRDEENRTPPNGRYVKEDTRTQWYGVRLNQHLELGPATVDAGFQAERRGVIASDLFPQHLRNLTSVFAKLGVHPISGLGVNVLWRADNYLDQTATSAGVNAAMNLSDEVVLFGGISGSYRFPTFQELHLPDTLFTLRGGSAVTESRTSIEAGVRVAAHNVSVNLKYFDYEGADNFFVPVSANEPDNIWIGTSKYQGAQASIAIRFGSFYTELSAQYLHPDRVAAEIFPPDWSGTGGVYFWDKIVGGHLDLKTGIRARMYSRSQEVDFNPQAQVYYSGSQNVAGAGVFDFVLIGHLGTAYIHVTMENLLDARYITTYFYPMNERILRFGLSWEFLD